MKCWYLGNQLHRTDGPAVIHPTGTQEWWQNGKLHRTDGPAIIFSNNLESWHLNGMLYSFDEFIKIRFPHDCKEKTLFLLKWGKK